MIKRAWLVVLAVAVCVAGGALSRAQAPAQAMRTVSEQYLFESANAERVQRGLQPLRWDTALYHAAGNHAREMASRENISHQYPGEAELTERGKMAGARFSTIAENVAMAPTAPIIHTAWMNSPGHRENLLDPTVDSVGISVLKRNGELYAVEDFDRSVERLSFDEQEAQVAELLQQTANVRVGSSDDARETCKMETGYAGSRQPWFVMRYTAGDLTRLPDQLKQKLATGKFHQAVVGACEARQKQAFTSFNMAVLLYP